MFYVPHVFYNPLIEEYARWPCQHKQPIAEEYLMATGSDSSVILEDIALGLIACINGVCSNPICKGRRGPAYRRRMITTLRRIERVNSDLGIVMPVSITTGMAGLIGAGSSSTRIVVHNTHPQTVHREVVEEHVHVPPPIHETETKTIVHRADGSQYVAKSVTKTHDGSKAQESSSSDEGGGYRQSKGTARTSEAKTIKERGESGDEEEGRKRRSRDRRYDKRRSSGRGRPRSSSREEHRRSGSHRHRSSSHDRRNSRSNERSRYKGSREKDNGRYESRKGKEKAEDRSKYRRRSRSHERSSRRDERDEHKYEESEREYDFSPSRHNTSSSSSSRRPSSSSSASSASRSN